MGRREGSIRARDANYEKHGRDFYKRLGKIGGSTKTTLPRGFAADRELARRAGAIGGSVSRRRKKTAII